MRKLRLLAVGLILFGLGLPVQGVSQEEAAGRAIVEFKSLASVTGPFVGSSNPVRGVPGGGIPWMIADGRGSLKSDGKLEIHVKGLVLAAGSLAGTNPIPFFRGLVSCMVINGTGNPDVVNVSTETFPADSSGDSDIDAKVELPTSCFAPIIFVTSPGGAWFAITGK